MESWNTSHWVTHRHITALSYRWGDPEDTIPIHVGGHIFSATRNLENALRSLRASCHLLVWVDAICINQRDLRERSEQITRMAAIYQCADIVIAWLGDDVQVENTALPMMEETYRYGQKDDDDSVSNRCDDLEHDQAMIKFFENPYWRRVWIIQELAFGRNIKLVCGSKAIPFDCLSRTIKRVNGRKSYSGLHVLTSCEHVGQILTIRSKIEASQPISLMEAMMRASRAECTDVRDRIYGLLGLVSYISI